MTSVVRFAGAVAIRRFAVVTVGAFQATNAGPTIGIAEVTVITGVTVRRRELLPTLALASGIGAVAGRIEVIAVAS